MGKSKFPKAKGTCGTQQGRMWDAVWDAVWDANKRRRPEIMAGRLHAHVPSRDPLPWTSRRAEGSPGPLGRPVLEGPALWFDLLLSVSLTRAPQRQ
jgi:hypothetical protein